MSEGGWEYAYFDLDDEAGCCWHSWAVCKRKDGYDVVHVPSLSLLTQFEAQAHARQFCEEIDGLIDWDTPDLSSVDPGIGPKRHRIALTVTGGCPDLQVIEGDN